MKDQITQKIVFERMFAFASMKTGIHHYTDMAQYIGEDGKGAKYEPSNIRNHKKSLRLDHLMAFKSHFPDVCIDDIISSNNYSPRLVSEANTANEPDGEYMTRLSDLEKELEYLKKIKALEEEVKKLKGE